MQVLVRDNNVDQALRALKKKMQREGIFREMKMRGHYEKPSEKRAREKAEAVRRARKLARKRAQREGLLPGRRARQPRLVRRSARRVESRQYFVLFRRYRGWGVTMRRRHLFVCPRRSGAGPYGLARDVKGTLGMHDIASRRTQLLAGQRLCRASCWPACRLPHARPARRRSGDDRSRAGFGTRTSPR